MNKLIGTPEKPIFIIKHNDKIIFEGNEKQHEIWIKSIEDYKKGTVFVIFMNVGKKNIFCFNATKT